MVYTITPISVATPSPEELKQNKLLKEWLHANKLMDTREGMLEREEVLIWLVELVKGWVKKVALSKQMSEESVEEANANLYTFGSYRLGVHGPGDDIDAHCVGPRWCERRGDFFGDGPHSLETLLRASALVDKIAVVPEAFVPVIKLTVRGFDIDLTYAQLATADVPPTLDLQAMHVLRGMNDESVRSINGCRVTDKIVSLVPNRAEFNHALRFLKFWGKRRGLYSNAMGYLGGINFAIIACYVSQLFPRQCASVLVQKFFMVLNSWNWAVPIRLTEIERGGETATDKMVWDSRENAKDSKALFPIITPCYPANNSTYNVLECTKAVMVAEFARGRELTKAGPAYDLDALAEAAPFFDGRAFRNFMAVTIGASSEEDFRAWRGYMGSKVRNLAGKVQAMLLCRPWPQEFVVPRELCEDGQFRSMWFMGVKKKPPANAVSQQFAQKKIDLRSHVSSFRMFVTGWEHAKVGMTVDVESLKFEQLPEWLFEGGVHPERVPLLALPAPEERTAGGADADKTEQSTALPAPGDSTDGDADKAESRTALPAPGDSTAGGADADKTDKTTALPPSEQRTAAAALKTDPSTAADADTVKADQSTAGNAEVVKTDQSKAAEVGVTKAEPCVAAAALDSSAVKAEPGAAPDSIAPVDAVDVGRAAESSQRIAGEGAASDAEPTAHGGVSGSAEPLLPGAAAGLSPSAQGRGRADSSGAALGTSQVVVDDGCTTRGPSDGAATANRSADEPRNGSEGHQDRPASAGVAVGVETSLAGDGDAAGGKRKLEGVVEEPALDSKRLKALSGDSQGTHASNGVLSAGVVRSVRDVDADENGGA